ncbi:hypothetical protein [Candidatus Spongiisocius sp.]|uniref:hypothetical protein n=1 Tax=Candidatus Spongiisocius sp. TaxID=3101273 RepID=UPI003B5C0719
MADPTPEGVAETLSRHGLIGPAFDAAAIAETLAGWDEAGRELDPLLSEHEVDAPAANPVSFPPKW